MHGLSDFHQYIVGDIHHGVYGVMPHRDEPALHPQGGLHILHVIHIMGQIPGAEISVDDIHADLLVYGIVADIAHVRLFHFFHQESRHLPGDAQYGLAVRTVGRDGNIEHIVVQSQVLLDIHAHRRIPVQDHDTVHICSGIPVFIQAQLLPGAEHAVGHHVLHLPGRDLQAVWKLRPHQAGRNLRPLEHIVRPREDQVVMPLLPAVDMADIKVRSFVFFNGSHLPYINLLNIFAKVRDLLHLKPGGEQLLLQLPGRHIDVHIFF